MDAVHEPVAGVRFSCSSELEEWRAKTLLTKEPETIAWLDHYLSGSFERGVLFDIGANIGVYSVYASVKHGASTYAFEPVLENFVRLEVNRALNGCDSLYPFHLAIGDRDQLVPLFLKDARIANSGSQILAPVDEQGAEYVPVATRRVLSMKLDTLVNDLGLPCPTVIKIDIDGLEGLVFKGAERVLGSPQLRSVLVELNSGDALNAVSDLLFAHGFRRNSVFDSIENHSSNRRRNSDKNVAENVVFSKE